ncbi:hypothetical protein JHW43_002034 [Diplocarpon mali]|nr:hypothetical protein JHW43_002034 [Diplocarpon mali]
MLSVSRLVTRRECAPGRGRCTAWSTLAGRLFHTYDFRPKSQDCASSGQPPSVIPATTQPAHLRANSHLGDRMTRAWDAPPPRLETEGDEKAGPSLYWYSQVRVHRATTPPPSPDHPSGPLAGQRARPASPNRGECRLAPRSGVSPTASREVNKAVALGASPAAAPRPRPLRPGLSPPAASAAPSPRCGSPGRAVGREIVTCVDPSPLQLGRQHPELPPAPGSAAQPRGVDSDRPSAAPNASRYVCTCVFPVKPGATSASHPQAFPPSQPRLNHHTRRDAHVRPTRDPGPSRPSSGLWRSSRSRAACLETSPGARPSPAQPSHQPQTRARKASCLHFSLGTWV